LERRLTTILAADMVGYSRLMGADEAGTLAALKALRRELIQPKETQYHGRTVKLMGDGALMEFASVVDAVTFAVEVQVAMAARNAEVIEDRRIVYRIGLNIGDIIVEGDDIYGDGVNVAARLEGLCEPGGVCVSRNVYNQVKDKLDLTFEDLGEKAVKNIAEPVTVYRIPLDQKAAALATPITVSIPQRGRGRWPQIAAGFVLSVVAIAGLVWWQPWAPDVEPASVEAMAFPLPDRPSIAVLPFDNLSNDPEQDYFADGITENVITELARFPSLFVIAENSTSVYKDEAVKVRQVSEDLGVQYVLEGSVQRSQERIRISVRLIDATTGRHLWSERYDNDVNDIFAVQDQTTEQIVATLATEQGVLADAWQKRKARKGTRSLEAYDLELQATQIAGGWTKDDFAQAKTLYEKAIAADPDYARPYANLAMTLVWEVYSKWAPEESLNQAVELAKEAIARDDGEAWGHWALGAAFLKLGHFDQAIAEYERALALNPNDADVLAESAFALAWVGRPEDGVKNALAAIRLNPRHPDYYLWALGVAYYDARKYEEAAATLASRKSPNLKSNLYLAAAYAQLGRESEAQKTIQKILEENPDSSIELWGNAQPYQHEAGLNHYIGGLRKAGLPQRPALPLPDKPSIAVLPFDNLSDDASQAHFADGMAEDLITDLSKISGLFVIARNSSFTYKGKTIDVKQVARELGVQYLLEGSVRRAGDQVRINAQLIDATTGGHVWAERYDRKLDNIFAVQNAITEKIVQALELHLTDSEQEQMDKEPRTSSVEAYDLVLKARKLMTQFDHKAAAEARDLLQRVIEIDPAYTEAHSLLGFYYFDEWRVWGRKRDQNLARALELATIAVELSPSDPAPHVLLALVYQWRREFDTANAEADTALALQPNDAITLSNLGSMLNWAGRGEEALGIVQQAIRLDPFHPPTSLERLAFAYAGVGDYDLCIEAANRGIALDPNFVGFHVDLAMCYAALGREQEARAAAAEILRTSPRFTLKAFSAYAPYTDELDLRLDVERLRKAGVPD